MPKMGRGYPPDWNSRRKKVYRRDGYECQNCGRTGGWAGNVELHAHHVVPKSQGGTHKISNLITLCKACHEAVHGRRKAPTAVDAKSQQAIEKQVAEWKENRFHRISEEFDVSYGEIKELDGKSDGELYAIADEELNKRHGGCPNCSHGSALSMKWERTSSGKKAKVIRCNACSAIFEEIAENSGEGFRLESVEDISQITSSGSAFKQELERQLEATTDEQSETTSSSSKYGTVKGHLAVATLTGWWTAGLGNAAYAGYKRATVDKGEQEDTESTDISENEVHESDKANHSPNGSDEVDENEPEGDEESSLELFSEYVDSTTDFEGSVREIASPNIEWDGLRRRGKDSEEDESEEIDSKLHKKYGPCPMCGSIDSFEHEMELRRECALPGGVECTTCETEFIEGYDEESGETLYSYPEEFREAETETSSIWLYWVIGGILLAGLAAVFPHPLLLFIGWVTLPIGIYFDLRYVRGTTDSRPSTPRWFWSSLISIYFINIAVGCAYLLWRWRVWN